MISQILYLIAKSLPFVAGLVEVDDNDHKDNEEEHHSSDGNNNDDNNVAVITAEVIRSAE